MLKPISNKSGVVLFVMLIGRNSGMLAGAWHRASRIGEAALSAPKISNRRAKVGIAFNVSPPSCGARRNHLASASGEIFNVKGSKYLMAAAAARRWLKPSANRKTRGM